MNQKTTVKLSACERHPNVETSLRCSKCDTFICPKCAVSTSNGMQCPDCAKPTKAAFLLPSVMENIKVGLVALAAGMLGSWIFMFNIGFFVLLLSTVYGYAVGEAVLRASNRKRGITIEIITGLAIVVGALGALVLAKGTGDGFRAFSATLPSPLFLAALFISTASAICRIRYL